MGPPGPCRPPDGPHVGPMNLAIRDALRVKGTERFWSHVSHWGCSRYAIRHFVLCCGQVHYVYNRISWWRHQMGTFSALLALCAGNSPVSGEFTAQRPVTRSFNIFFDLRPNKRLSKQSRCWWFEMPSRPLWRHYNVPRLIQRNHTIVPVPLRQQRRLTVNS